MTTEETAAPYSCPACGSDQVAGRSSCACGADLTWLQVLDSVAAQWFNQALAALEEGRRGAALEWMAAYCAARPNDGAALRSLTKIWAQLGCWPEARDAWRRAAAANPSAPELQELRAAIDEAAPQASSETAW